MENFWVAEESEGIGEAVRRQLGERDRRTAAGGSPWLLVVSPRAAERRRQLPTGCRTVLLPGGAGGLLSGLDPAAAVSYGTGPRDTLTLVQPGGAAAVVRHPAGAGDGGGTGGGAAGAAPPPARITCLPCLCWRRRGPCCCWGCPRRSWAGTAGRSGAARDERPAGRRCPLRPPHPCYGFFMVRLMRFSSRPPPEPTR